MPDRRRVLVSAAAALAAPHLAAAAPNGADVRLTRLFDGFFARKLQDEPETATQLGLDTGANASLKSELHRASLVALSEDKARTADQLDSLRGLGRRGLSGMAAVNYDTVLYDLDLTDRANRRFAYGGEGAGTPYVISQIDGAWQEVPDFLDSQHTIATRADCEAYLARLDAFAHLIDEELERVRHDAGLGVIPPDFALKGAIDQTRTLNAPAAKSSLVASLAGRAKAKGVAGDWRARATKVYESRVRPALARQVALLESLQPRAVHDAGVWRLPDGEAYYAAALQAQTTTTLTAAEIHQLGLDVTRDMSARADALFRKIGMTSGTVAERYGAFFKDPRYVYPNTDAGKAKEVADLNVLVQAMQKRLPEYFAVLPKAGLEIRRIPPATEAGASTHYTGGSLDGTRPGIYWLNLRDTAEAPFWDMPTTTFHEGIPGHHLQGSLQNQASLPMLRKVSFFGAYIEGWALYAEQLADEMGFYADQPAWELGYIHDALLRSGRLVTDTGIHAMRWSREKAVQALHDIDGDPVSLCGQEIERYACWPGQACTYMVGKVQILRLRDKARAALGPRFDIRRFHDAVLSVGAVPLTVLETVVDAYIVAARAPT